MFENLSVSSSNLWSIFQSYSDGRKRARTMEYIDSQVDINDVESPEPNIHIGEHIHAQFDLSVSMINETEVMNTSVRPISKRVSERSFLSRQLSDMTMINETSKTSTELKGRDHILRMMKTNNQKPMMDLKNHKFIQEMFAKRQEQEQINQPLADFAQKYGLIDEQGKRSKSRVTSEFMYIHSFFIHSFSFGYFISVRI